MGTAANMNKSPKNSKVFNTLRIIVFAKMYYSFAF